MLKLFLAFCLVLWTSTMVYSQQDAECRQPPRVDPRVCCNIPKSFDKNDFPECFTEEDRSGAGGGRGSNRQKRAAWGGGGYGGQWHGHHGHDHESRFGGGSGSGFRGGSDRNGERNGEASFGGQRDSQGTFRDVWGHNAGFRAERGNGADFRGERGNDADFRGERGNDADFRGERGNEADFRGVQDDAGFRDGGSRFYSGGPGPGPFACQLECVLNKTKVLTNNNIDRAVAVAYFKSAFASLSSDVLVPAVEKCADRFNKFISSVGKTPEGPTGAPQASRNGVPCGHGGGLFVMCIHHEIFRNCPADIWTNNTDCNALKTFVEKCHPANDDSDRGRGPSN